MTYIKTKLSSGIRLITMPMKGTKTITVLAAVKAGSNFETKKVNGISHFLEHMMFKGTKKRPTTLAIAEELDSIGGEYNAFTGKEWTGYYAKADSSHLPLILDIISDIYLNALHDPQEMEREKLVILEEMNMYQDTPTRYVDELLEELLYGDQPQGWKIIGTQETVKAITRAKLKAYFNARYRAQNTTVIIAGDIPEKSRIKKVVERYFKSIRTGGSFAKLIAVREAQQKIQTAVHYKKTDQTHLALALRAYHADHKKLPALHLLHIILGGNMSSRLFINVREREGLGYYIRSSVESYSGCGYLMVKAGIDNKRVMRGLQLIMKELREIREKGITEAELTKAKEYFRGKLALSLETSDEVAFWLGGQELVLGKIKTPQQALKETEKVTMDGIREVAKEVIQNKSLNLAVIGPYKDKRQFEKMLSV